MNESKMLYLPQALRFNVGDRVRALTRDHTSMNDYIITEVVVFDRLLTIADGQYFARNYYDARRPPVEWAFMDAELEPVP